MNSSSEMVKDFAQLHVAANSGPELCRTLVHSPLTLDSTIGSDLVIVNQDASISLVSSYGYSMVSKHGTMSLWDDNVVSKSLRESTETEGDFTCPDSGETLYLYVYPYLNPTIANGASVMIKRKKEALRLDLADQRTLSLVGALWLDALGLAGMKVVGKSEPSPQSITERQMQVLKMMANGRTNSEIAKDLLLSESSIRQETVKIYKALGVGSRQQASKRAMHLGLIDRLAI
jgi:DNA-binding CsgD family transcriptional regulator